MEDPIENSSRQTIRSGRIVFWAVLIAIVFGGIVSRWSDQLGPYSVAPIEFPATDYAIRWPQAGEDLEIRLSSYLASNAQLEALEFLARGDLLGVAGILENIADSGGLEVCGLLGIERLAAHEKAEAVRWFRMGADRGDPVSAFYWGELVLLDDEVDGVPHEAVKALKLAAEKGYAPAQVLLGVLYQSQDQRVLAREWFEAAAELDESEGFYHLGLSWAGEADRAQQGSEEVVMNFQSAATRGHLQAMYALGRCLETGFGIDASFVEARRWMQLAASMGHSIAQSWCESRGISVRSLALSQQG